MKNVKATFLQLAFAVGYSQLIPKRSIRRFLAGTEVHRAWLGGNQGNVGEPEGVLYREWYTNRKQHRNASFKQVCRELRQYYGLYGKKQNSFLTVAIIKNIMELYSRDLQVLHTKVVSRLRGNSDTYDEKI